MDMENVYKLLISLVVILMITGLCLSVGIGCLVAPVAGFFAMGLFGMALAIAILIFLRTKWEELR